MGLAKRVETARLRILVCGRQIGRVGSREWAAFGCMVERAYSRLLQASKSMVEREALNKNACSRMQRR